MAAEVKSRNSSRSFLSRRAENRGTANPGLRVLTASAAVLDVRDKVETKRVRRMRQSWQEQSWNYVDEVGEVSYAHQFLANCTGRMKIFPAAYATGNYDEDPVPLTEIEGIPPEVIAAATEAMNDLGTGRLACSAIMESTSWNLSVAGEGFVLGITDPSTGQSTFSVRSIDEIVVREDTYKLRELPGDNANSTQGEPLDPDDTFLARIWTPHPRWRLFARSSMRAVLDVCEELQILNRVIRSTGRSRVAQNGMLLIPDTISAEGQAEDNDDPQSDPFMAHLTDAMTTGIADEGVASSTVPIVLRGPALALAEIRHLVFDRPLDPIMVAQRSECLGRFASGMDLPKEVITGMADLNHWTAWQVSSDTFSEHVEPHVVKCVDALTVGYFRAALMVDPRLAGANRVWLARLCVWYDPSELLTNPNRVADATAGHDALVISDKAYRDILGFADEDAPNAAEIELRMVRATKAWPPNVLEALLHMLDPQLQIPPLTKDGIPGLGPKGAIPVPVPGIAGPTPPPASPPSVESTPAAPASPDSMPSGGTGMPSGGPSGINASAKPRPSADQVRLSRKLVDIDADLRRSLQIASSASIRRSLEKAGAKLRTKSADVKDKDALAVISGVPSDRVSLALGRAKVEAFGGASLVKSDWSDVRAAFDSWVPAAQEQALAVAAQLAGAKLSSVEIAKARSRFTEARSAAWTALSASLDALAVRALMPPADKPESVTAAGKPTAAAPVGSRLVIPSDIQVGDSTAEDTDVAISVDPSTLMPTTTMRAVLNIAGGSSPDDSPLDTSTGLVPDDALADGGALGQIGTGEGVSDLLAEADMSTPGYQWIHGLGGQREFEPHADLDGVEFASFDDDALASSDDWIGDYYTPGDHDGCTCDFMPMWAASDVGDRPIDDAQDNLAGDDAEAEPVAASASASVRTRPARA